MAIRTYKVTLDSKNTIAPEPVFLRQGDKTGAVVIDATLMDNGTPVSLSGLTPMFKANTADGQAVIADSTGFNIVNASGGEFTYQVPNALSAVPGKITTAYFSFSDSSGSESTFDVAFIIKKAVDITKPQANDYITIIDGTLDSLRDQMNSLKIDFNKIINNYNMGDFYNKSETDSKDVTTLSSAKSYTDNSLSGIVALPETFINLAAIQSKYPNGANGVMVAADNGHKYIWSNNAWTDAGIYQSVGVADDSISANKVKANISPGFIVNDGNTVPNFNLTTGQLEINSSLNVIYKGNIVSNYKFYPSVLDLPKRCGIYFNVKSATFFTGSNYSDDDVAVGGRLGNNCFLNGQYTVDGKSPYPDRAPSYDIYSVDDSLGTWDIGNNKIDLNNIYINFDQTSVNIQKRTIDLVDRGTKYLYLSGTNLIAENPPLSTDGGKIYLGWLNGYRKVYHLSSSFELKIAGASQNITNYVTSVADTIAMGDSITFGLHATDPTTGSWPALLSKNVGVNVFNEGASSATWQNGSDDDTISFVNRAKSIDWTQANDIILFGGTNDFAQDLPIGKVDDDFDETLLGAMNNTLKAIYASNAKANIMLITPMWRSRINAGSVDVETTPNGIGLYLRDYVDAVKLIGDKYHIPVLDLYHEFNVNSLNFSTWLADGLHPNDAGYAKLAEKIAKFIMSSK